MLGYARDRINMLFLCFNSEGCAPAVRMPVQLVEEQKVETGLIGEGIAVVQHEVPRKFWREERAGDAHAKRKDVREGTHKQFAAIVKLVDWITGTTAKEAVLLSSRRIRFLGGRPLHRGVECIKEQLVRIVVPVGAIDDDHLAHES